MKRKIQITIENLLEIFALPCVRSIRIRPAELRADERVYVINNTIEYYAFGFGVTVVTVRKKTGFECWGFNSDEMNALWNLPIGEKYETPDYGNTASVVRLA